MLVGSKLVMVNALVAEVMTALPLMRPWHMKMGTTTLSDETEPAVSCISSRTIVAKFPEIVAEVAVTRVEQADVFEYLTVPEIVNCSIGSYILKRE